MTASIAPLAMARLAAAAAEACDGVAAVTPGSGVAATHGPGGRVDGVIVTPGAPGGARVAVHIEVAPMGPLPELAAGVRAAVAAALADADPDRAPWTVDVHIVDLVPDGGGPAIR